MCIPPTLPLPFPLFPTPFRSFFAILILAARLSATPHVKPFNLPLAWPPSPLKHSPLRCFLHASFPSQLPQALPLLRFFFFALACGLRFFSTLFLRLPSFFFFFFSRRGSPRRFIRRPFEIRPQFVTECLFFVFTPLDRTFLRLVSVCCALRTPGSNPFFVSALYPPARIFLVDVDFNGLFFFTRFPQTRCQAVWEAFLLPRKKQ